MEALIDADEHGVGRQGGVVEDLEAVRAGDHARACLGAGVTSAYVHGDRDHTRLSAEDAHDCGASIFREGADGLRGVDDLEGVERTRQRGEDGGLRHGDIDRAILVDGVAAGEQAGGVDVGDRTGGCRGDVAADEDGGDSASGDKGLGLWGFRVIRASDSGDWSKTEVAEAVAEEIDCVLGDAAEGERRLDGRDRASGCAGGRNASRGGVRAVEDLEHVFNGSDAGDGLLAELADAEAERADEAAVYVDRASAHAGDDAGVVGFGAVQASEDHILAGGRGSS